MRCEKLCSGPNEFAGSIPCDLLVYVYVYVYVYVVGVGEISQL